VEKRARIEQLWLERPGLVAGITGALCLIAWFRFDRVYFDYNLLNMQTRGLPAVVFEKKLIKSAEKAALFCVMISDSLEKAAKLEAYVTNLPPVASAQSMTLYLSEDQTRKLALIGEVKKTVAPIVFRDVDTRPVNIPELSRTLYSLQGYLGMATNEVSREKNPELFMKLSSLRDSIDPFRQEMLADPVLSSVKLAEFQRALFDDIRATFTTLREQDNRDRLRAQDLPPALRHRFISRSGDRYLVQIYPKKDVWQRENQEEFVQALRKVDPDVTGPPVQLYEYTTLLKESYEDAAYYALGAIALLVFVHFRSVTCVVLSLLPVAIGTIWMVGFMGWFGIPFNPANIMTLPLVIGIGVTNGIHILNRYAEEQKPSILAKSTGKAVLVSALTTIVGFGSLILAGHQGIASLGYIMSVGTATCMIAALTFLPALLNLLSHRGWKLKRPSDDNAQSPPGREEPR
jgi:preprotein translocase subunit SecF